MKIKQKLKWFASQLSNHFKNSFQSTVQFMLDHYLSEYVEDVSKFNITNLLTGIQDVQLNKDFFNNLLGVGFAQLEHSIIKSIKIDVKKMQIQISGVDIVISLCKKVSRQEYVEFLKQTQKTLDNESHKLLQLQQLRKQIYNSQDDVEQQQQPNDHENMKTLWQVFETYCGNSSIIVENVKLTCQWDDLTDSKKLEKTEIIIDLQLFKCVSQRVSESNGSSQPNQQLQILSDALIQELVVTLQSESIDHQIIKLDQLTALQYFQLNDQYQLSQDPLCKVQIPLINVVLDPQDINVFLNFAKKSSVNALYLQELRGEYQSKNNKDQDASPKKQFQPIPFMKASSTISQTEEPRDLPMKGFKEDYLEQSQFDDLLKSVSLDTSQKLLISGSNLIDSINDDQFKWKQFQEEVLNHQDASFEGKLKLLQEQGDKINGSLKTLNMVIFFDSAPDRKNNWCLQGSKYSQEIEEDHLLFRMKGLQMINDNQKNILVVSKVHLYHFYSLMNKDIQNSNLAESLNISFNDDEDELQNSNLFQSCVDQDIYQSIIASHHNPIRPDKQIESKLIGLKQVTIQELIRFGYGGQDSHEKTTYKFNYTVKKIKKQIKSQEIQGGVIKIVKLDNDIKIKVQACQIEIDPNLIENCLNLIKFIDQQDIQPQRKSIHLQDSDDQNELQLNINLHCKSIAISYVFNDQQNAEFHLESIIGKIDSFVLSYETPSSHSVPNKKSVLKALTMQEEFTNFSNFTFSSFQVSLLTKIQNYKLLEIGQDDNYQPLITIGRKKPVLMMRSRLLLPGLPQNPINILGSIPKENFGDSQNPKDEMLQTNFKTFLQDTIKESPILIRASLPVFNLSIPLITSKITLLALVTQVDFLTQILNGTNQEKDVKQQIKSSPADPSYCSIWIEKIEIRIQESENLKDLLILSMHKSQFFNIVRPIVTVTTFVMKNMFLVDCLVQNPPHFLNSDNTSQRATQQLFGYPSDQVWLYSNLQTKKIDDLLTLKIETGGKTKKMFINPFSLAHQNLVVDNSTINVTYQTINQINQHQTLQILVNNLTLRNHNLEFTLINHLQKCFQDIMLSMPPTVAHEDSQIQQQDPINFKFKLNNILIETFPSLSKETLEERENKRLNIKHSKSNEVQKIDNQYYYGGTRSIVRISKANIDGVPSKMKFHVSKIEFLLQRTSGLMGENRNPLLILFEDRAIVSLLEGQYQFVSCLSIQDLGLVKTQQNIQVKITDLLVNSTYDIGETLLQHVSCLADSFPQSQSEKVDDQQQLPIKSEKEDAFSSQLTQENWMQLILLGKDYLFQKNIKWCELEVEVDIEAINFSLTTGYSFHGCDEEDTEFVVDEESEQSFELGRVSQHQQRQTFTQEGLKLSLQQLKLKICKFNNSSLYILHLGDLQINDNINKSKYALLLAKDKLKNSSQQQKDHFLAISIVSIGQSLDLNLSVHPIRFCLSGYTLKFLYYIERYHSMIPSFKLDWLYQDLDVDDDDNYIMIMERPVKQDDKPVFISNFLIDPFFAVLSYDGQGIHMIGPLESLLRVASFNNLKINMKQIQIQNTTYISVEEFTQQAMDLIQKSIGSTTELTFNALGSLKALNIFSHLYKGVRSLLLSPIKYGLFYGSIHGVSRFSKGFSSSLISLASLPSSTVEQITTKVGLKVFSAPFKYFNSKCQYVYNKINPEEEVPPQFLKIQRKR